MAAQPTTRWQVSGYRFLVRRMEHALVRRDVRMLHDPMRSQSRALAVGALLSLLVVAGCGALALIRPQDSIGSARIVVGKESGAMFVVVDETLHPVLNLASARLIVGSADRPVIVKESELGTRPRGALLGIPGAPSALPHQDPGAWTLCDSIAPGGARAVSTTIVVGGPRLGDGADELDSGEALLVQSLDGTWLVHNGTRSRVDLGDHAVSLAFDLEGIVPRPMSEGLLSAIPEAPALVPPAIRDAGQEPAYPMDGKPIGSVVQVQDAKETRYYVVLSDGLQRVGRATADLIRFADSHGVTEMDAVAPDVVARPPQSSALPVGTFPETPPRIVDAHSEPVGCLMWRPVPGDGGIRATIAVVAGNTLPLPAGAKPVTLAQSDGPGSMADQFYAGPGSGALVHSTGITPSSERQGALFFVADTGVRYGIENRDSATLLGFPEESIPAPWPILGLLAPGPRLGREDALLAHDGVAPDDQPMDVPAP
ncbi:type VII secretion protein EccB [Rhodococcus sp. Q]|uniref:type VII secretion protein EccB n=1 Tax=Rhodococcus sp. Q TaxID=2502252 RepID=UPI0010F871B6|nr:type VII secretion protein EccB [Rhodococcus sp. Q]